jgi:filamentous hemagglutinin family protein
MRVICKATNWRLKAFLGAIKTGLFTSAILLPGMLLSSCYAIAQVTSDGTTNTIVNPNGNNFTILNGIKKGNNLFHSFSNFSVPTGGSASFDLFKTSDITTIFSRVTGGNVSNIDGLISTLNSTNPVSLFLMNPSGIIFGQNAKLNIGGSFLGTTANSIKFADGAEFSAVNASNTSLLTMSVPVGLQMGNNPGSITVRGSGHNLIAKDPSFSPYINPGSANSLQVKPGKTLALIGGDIKLDGAILQAVGRIELASLGEGEVSLIQTLKGLELDDAKVSNFNNIQLSQRTLVEVSGAGAGSIKIQGNQISVKDGSVMMVQNRGIQPAGDINVNAQSINLSGSIPSINIRTSFVNETLAGNSGNIKIKTGDLKIEDAAGVFSRTLGSIDINATKSVDVIGFSAINPNLFSSIGSATFSQGNSGNIHLSTQNLSVLDGGVIVSTSFGTGSAGSVNINSQTTQVASSIVGLPIATSIAANTYGKGDAGKIIINTQTLSIQGDAILNTISFNSGNSGNVTVNATESVKLNGGNAIKVPRISSSVVPESSISLKFLGLPKVPTGNAGNITINTPDLKVSDYGYISVRNDGIGNAGTLRINADLVQLENNSRLFAPNNSGKGGNIFVEADSLKLADNSLIATNASGGGNGGNITINLRDSLVMRSSQINTDSLSKGNGGNIMINAPFIIGLENSDIIANAVQGNGGNINITTQGIFGLDYRPQLTPNSDITASSEFGINGTVDIHNLGVDPSSGLVELPVNLVDSSKLIATGCSNNTGSSFVATGRGGIPENPNRQLTSDVSDGLGLRTWSDIRDLSAYRNTSEVIAQIPQSGETLMQATSWHRNDQGKVELIADKSPTQIQPSLTCAAVTKS